MDQTWKNALSLARRAMDNAYAPYSQFRVGACLVTDTGENFTGCNIENASYGVTICAERVALCKAVSEGHRRFALLALCSDSEQLTFPCGVCRQALSEFAPGLTIVCASRKLTDAQAFSLGALLPHSFSKEDMV